MGSRNINDGDVFGRLTVKQSYHSKSSSEKWMHLCICECGQEKIAYGNHLKSGSTVSCGCFKYDSFISTVTKHSDHGSRTYMIWKGIRRRCNNKNDSAYHRYGGAGIKVCDEWSDYSKFLEDMGECGEGMSIDRIEGSKGYYKENCRWATCTQQARNRKSRTDLPKGIKVLPSGRFAVSICANYKNHYVGSFDCVDSAIKARKDAEDKYWGDNK